MLPELFRSAGHRVTELADGPVPASAADVVLLQGNAAWFPRAIAQLSALAPGSRPFVVIWHGEPLPPPRDSRLPRARLHRRELAKILLRDRRATDVYTNARRLQLMVRRGLPDLLAVTTQGRAAYLRERGIRCEWVPLGYEPGHGENLGLERDIDILFLGALDVPRRRKSLRRLRRKGLEVTAVGSWSAPEYWGTQRTRLLNRAKVMLNISRHPGDLADLRFILGMANGACVVSEPVHRPAPFQPGEHYVSLELDAMPESLPGLLATPGLRTPITEAGHRLVTGELTLERSVARLLDLIADARARR